jgi:putative Mg2+ transporter-C (MgtC) family protein
VPGTHNLNGLDPTRVVQGILTGIGFLGAGVIVRDGYSVRGLTTAASIWTTAAIGIVVGNGFIVPGILFALATLAILSFMKKLEDNVTAQHHIRCQVSCPTGGLSEEGLRVILSEHHFKVKEMAYDMSREKHECRYSADVWAHGKKHARMLADTLKTRDDINGFQIVPSRD